MAIITGDFATRLSGGSANSSGYDIAFGVGQYVGGDIEFSFSIDNNQTIEADYLLSYSVKNNIAGYYASEFNVNYDTKRKYPNKDNVKTRPLANIKKTYPAMVKTYPLNKKVSYPMAGVKRKYP